MKGEIRRGIRCFKADPSCHGPVISEELKGYDEQENLYTKLKAETTPYKSCLDFRVLHNRRKFYPSRDVYE